ncbi:hypothetical protein UPYG_G00078460 [Umbra pygmaea]|uniref:Reverse transcriptase n=1 Tax=Umbra pygmaea TaxID=75934 RepID=A0ABD0XD79_UMBPY
MERRSRFVLERLARTYSKWNININAPKSQITGYCLMYRWWWPTSTGNTNMEGY